MQTAAASPIFGHVSSAPSAATGLVSSHASAWRPRFTLRFDDDTPLATTVFSAFVGSFALTLAMTGVGFIGNDLSTLFTRTGLLNFSLSQSIAFSLWIFGSVLNARWLPRYIDWMRAPGRAVTVALAANVIGVYLIVPTLFLIFFVGLSGWSLARWWSVVTFSSVLPSLIITLVITLVYQSQYFLQEWRDSALRAEQLNTATLAARFETLNAQVNPHFLFNSLNVLSALVRRDPPAAEAFIQGLSEVYRYVLEVREEALVPLSRELQALDAYAKLVTMRFGPERLRIDIQVDPADERLVVPLALQMLVENAVKHNGATRKTPLVIEVLAKADTLIVRNNRVALFEPVDGTQLGLNNIAERYRLATGREVAVESTPEAFAVKLPL